MIVQQPNPPQPKAPARQALARPAPKTQFPTDEESVALRRRRAEEEAASVRALSGRDSHFGDFEVSSRQWSEAYRVEIRALDRFENTCSCQDYRMNRLGTCKHIERVLQHLSRRGKRAFAAAARGGPPRHEVFLDLRAEPPAVRLLRPSSASPAAARVLDPFFGADGRLLGEPLDGVPALERAVAALPPHERDRVRLSRGLAPWIEQLRRRAARAEARAAFLEDVRVGKRSLNPVRHPLYPYQQDGMLHLAFGERALLADEMGLGKTVQAIAACELLRELRGIRRVLVVCPASLKAEWEEQIREFTGRDAQLVFGPRPARERAYDDGAFYTVANYEQARADVGRINDLMAPDVVILDEAQRIKNWPTRTAKTIKRLRSPYAFVLTGTPLENRIEEIYSLVEFVDPDLFGALFRFQREFFVADDEGGIRPNNLPELHRRIRAVMLRRRKADVEESLPDRTVKTFFVAMEKEQRARYAEYEEAAARLAAQARKRPLAPKQLKILQNLLACMRMVCDTPYILDRNCRICPKLTELESILDEALADPTAKALVFSEWVLMLDLVKELAEARAIGFAEHTGRIEQRRRREEIARFKNDPACRLFLSSEAGGTGLNLQAANVVINLDLPWNPAKLEQRIARAWRKHQARSVTVINLVTEDSIEHAMLAKLSYKRSLADAVLDGRAPDASFPAASGRAAYMEMVEGLLGASGGAGEEAEEPSAAARAVPTGARLKEDLAARFPSQLLGLEACDGDRGFVAVVRDRASAAGVREVAQAAAPDARIEVLDRETYALLQRLREAGAIAFTTRPDPLFRSPELDAPDRAAPPTVKYPERARAHWAAASRALKMATVLTEGGLPVEAAASWRDVFRVAVEALHVFERGSPPAGAFADADLGHSGGGVPAGGWAALRARLAETPANDDDARDLARETAAAVADLRNRFGG